MIKKVKEKGIEIKDKLFQKNAEKEIGEDQIKANDIENDNAESNKIEYENNNIINSADQSNLSKKIDNSMENQTLQEFPANQQSKNQGGFLKGLFKGKNKSKNSPSDEDKKRNLDTKNKIFPAKDLEDKQRIYPNEDQNAVENEEESKEVEEANNQNTKKKKGLITKMKEGSAKLKQGASKKIDAAKKKYNNIKQKIIQKKSEIAQIVGLDVMKMKYDEIVTKVKNKTHEIAVAIRENVTEQIREFLLKQKSKFDMWLRLKIEQIILKLLEKVRPRLKKMLKDPNMWQCVKDLIDDAVDEFWPDIEDAVLFNLRMAIDEPYIEEPPKTKPFCVWAPFVYFRRWYLYITDGYDSNFWERSHWFSWWFLLLLSIFPYYGAQTIFFMVVFLMIDKTDEFQLVKFILDFKKMQAVTVGIISSIIGYLLLFQCTVLRNFEDNPDYSVDCTTSGAGSSTYIYIDLPAFVIQPLLVWISFMLLPCSSPKGQPKFRYSGAIVDTNDVASCCFCDFNIKRGGRLKCFMIYDMIAWLISVGVGLGMLFGFHGQKNVYQIKGIFYFVRILYGFLSFPFLIFAIPGFQLLLTRSRPTAYDKYGNCIPKIKGLKFIERASAEEDGDEAEELLGCDTDIIDEIVESPTKDPQQD